MLLNSLFFTDQLAEGDFSIEATIRIDKNHPIFEGHFPGQPILPGVCMMQLIKELIESADQKKYMIETAGNMKFLNVIDPTVHNRINASILIEHRTEHELKINASLFAGDITFFKLKASLKPA
jgi:3-hydroxyacyl-[acyl-carrier-protein] dehydratase